VLAAPTFLFLVRLFEDHRHSMLIDDDMLWESNHACHPSTCSACISLQLCLTLISKNINSYLSYSFDSSYSGLSFHAPCSLLMRAAAVALHRCLLLCMHAHRLSNKIDVSVLLDILCKQHCPSTAVIRECTHLQHVIAFPCLPAIWLSSNETTIQ
jgi:hypothetical protein